MYCMVVRNTSMSWLNVFMGIYKLTAYKMGLWSVMNLGWWWTLARTLHYFPLMNFLHRMHHCQAHYQIAKFGQAMRRNGPPGTRCFHCSSSESCAALRKTVFQQVSCSSNPSSSRKSCGGSRLAGRVCLLS